MPSPRVERPPPSRSQAWAAASSGGRSSAIGLAQDPSQRRPHGLARPFAGRFRARAVVRRQPLDEPAQLVALAVVVGVDAKVRALFLGHPVQGYVLPKPLELAPRRR